MKRLLSLILMSGCVTLTQPYAFAQVSAPIKPNVERGQKLFNEGDDERGITACVSCHGEGGLSMIPENPKLAGQHPDYIIKQLTNFVPAAGADAPLRQNPVMSAMAQPLTEQDRMDIAAYLGEQAPPVGVAQNIKTVSLGERIFRGGIASKGVPACAACHGPAGAGIPSQYPHIAGQFSEYTAAQLHLFRSGERANNVPMLQVAANLSDAEIAAVSDYIAGLRRADNIAKQ